MDDDGGAGEDDRAMELATLAAIYPEMVIDERDPYSATLDLAVTPINPLRILFRAIPEANTAPTLPTDPPLPIESRKASIAEQQDQAPLDEHELSHLPPLSLRIALPATYPSETPPVVSISTTPPWLADAVLDALRNDCARLWEEEGRYQILFTYIDYLQQRAETAFDLVGKPDVQFSSDMKLSLLALDRKIKREIFERETFDCGVCLEPKKGKDCHKLSKCGHVFCVECLQDFYKSCITEGDVGRVTCMDPTCGKDEVPVAAEGSRKRKHHKEDKTLNPSELILIPIEQELVQRYVRIKRKKELEADKYTIYCPRTWCQGAAKSKRELLRDEESDNESDSEEQSNQSADSEPPPKFDPETLPVAERLSVCLDCNFAFCCACLKTWHGAYARCSPRRTAELAAEEKASLEYINSFSTPCPTCDARCQKSQGCNHMTCSRCQTHFCYLCSKYLDPQDPYVHYNQKGSPCFYKLWELEGGDGQHEELPPNFGNHPAPAPEAPPRAVGDWEFGDDFADSDVSSDDEGDLALPPPPAAPEPPAAVRDVRIEIVNFARPGANQVFELPNRPRNPDPPPQPEPNPPGPRRRRHRQGPGERRDQAHRDAARAQQQQHERAAGNAHRNANAAGPGDRGRFGVNNPNNRAVGGAARRQNVPVGIARFIQMAQEDIEDEWDSDELDDI